MRRASRTGASTSTAWWRPTAGWSSAISPPPASAPATATARWTSPSSSCRPRSSWARSAALGAARSSIGDDALADALPYLQPAALTPALRDEVHDGGLKVGDLRTQVATALERRAHADRRAATGDGQGDLLRRAHRVRRLADHRPARGHRSVDDHRRAPAGELGVARARPLPRAASSCQPSAGAHRSRAPPPSLCTNRRARVGNQVREPDGPELGRPHRRQHPLSAKAGAQRDVRGRGRAGSTVWPAPSSRYFSCC